MNHIRLLLPTTNFMEELDVLLSTSPKDGTPLVGDFNIHLDKPQAADFHTLLASFELKSVNWGILLSAMVLSSLPPPKQL